MHHSHEKKVLTLALYVLIFLHFLPMRIFSQGGTEDLIGKPAPNFTLKDLSGKTIHFSIFKGKPVLLEFWATWCPDCRETFPGLEKIYKELSPKGLAVVTVSVDTKQKAVAPFMEKNGYTAPVLLDDGKMRKLYHVQRIPTAFLIDRKGIIRTYFVEYGVKGQSGLEEEIRKIMEQD